MNKELKTWEQDELSDQEINELADWYESLTIAQLAFIKASYLSMLDGHAHEIGQRFVH